MLIDIVHALELSRNWKYVRPSKKENFGAMGTFHVVNDDAYTGSDVLGDV